MARRAVALDPEEVEAQGVLGGIYLVRGEHELSRSHFEEDSYAVGVGLFDHFGVINRFKRLPKDDIGGTVGCDWVAFTKMTAVEIDSFRCCDRKEVQITIRFGHWCCDFTVNGRDSTQEEEVAIEDEEEEEDGSERFVIAIPPWSLASLLRFL